MTASPGEATPGEATPVRFRDVSKSYDGRSHVVERLNLDIRDGEFLTLLGPSGSGKTTTLMMLAGFEHPTSGEILLGGKPVNGVPPYQRNIGVVFQNYALFPHMTVAENVAFPLRVRGKLGRAEIAQRVRRVIDTMGLSGQLDAKPRRLSGGQQQRVALARAMVFEPRLILMDEPLGALDLKLRQRLQLEIKHLHEATGATILYVTHDQGEALTLSDRIAVFDHGQVQQVADPRAIYDRPANRFVADFMGENNFLEGRIAGREADGVVIELRDGRRVPAGGGRGWGPGDTVTLCLRPEHVRLVPPDAGERLAEGIVEELIYRGDRITVRLQVAGNPNFMAAVPVTGETDCLVRGSAVGLVWSADRAHALDRDG